MRTDHECMRCYRLTTVSEIPFQYDEIYALFVFDVFDRTHARDYFPGALVYCEDDEVNTVLLPEHNHKPIRFSFSLNCVVPSCVSVMIYGVTKMVCQ